MVMETIQIRLTKELMKRLERLVREGLYPNKSEAVRDAVRRLILEQELGELGEEMEEMGEEFRERLPERIREIRAYCH